MMMRRGMMRRHAVVGRLRVVMLRLVMETTGPAMAERRPMMMRIVRILLVVVVLTGLAWMRVLWRVIDIVVRSYSVVARQRVDAWGPPERTALAGRRVL